MKNIIREEKESQNKETIEKLLPRNKQKTRKRKRKKRWTSVIAESKSKLSKEKKEINP